MPWKSPPQNQIKNQQMTSYDGSHLYIYNMYFPPFFQFRRRPKQTIPVAIYILNTGETLDIHTFLLVGLVMLQPDTESYSHDRWNQTR